MTEAERHSAQVLLAHVASQLAIALNSLGGVALAEGKLEEAAPYFREALGLFEQSLGHRHLQVAMVLDNLGVLLWNQRDYVRARNHQERALDIRETLLGLQHPDVASSLVSLAGTAVAREEFESAQELLERAISIFDSRGQTSPLHGNALHNLAVVQRALGEPTALPTARRALFELEARLGPDHLEVARCHANLGWILEDLGEPALAQVHLARAVEIRSATQALPGDIAHVRFGLARAKWALDEKELGVRTAIDALEEARSAGDEERALADRIHEWIEGRSR